MPTAYKTILIIVFLVVIFELGQALYFLMVDKGESRRMAWALTRRIALSFVVIGLVVLGIWMGWLNPHG
ncbi:MAG TPA: twin transmembrane helix small protein [Rhodanobacteraceae bacterium]|nr:twin transmembrane helix small protein [Rhodanobacteraceae bacterium]